MTRSKLVEKEVAEARANGTLSDKRTLKKTNGKANGKANGKSSAKSKPAKVAPKKDAAQEKAVAQVTATVKQLEEAKPKTEKEFLTLVEKADKARLSLRDLKRGEAKNGLREQIIAVRAKARKQMRKLAKAA